MFLTEAGLLDEVCVVRCVPEESGYHRVLDVLSVGVGAKPTFPTVELEPGVLASDSDALIERFASSANVESQSLPTLKFYEAGVFALVLELYRENQALKARGE